MYIKKRGEKILCLLLACLLTGAGAFTALASGDGLEDARDRVESAEEQARDLEDASERFQEYLDELNDQLDQLTSDMEDLEAQRGDLESQLEDTSGELSDARETEARQYENMKKRIQYMYENRDSGFIGLIFSEDSLSSILNKAEYAMEMASYDREMLTAYKETKDLVAQKEEELLAKQEELDQVASELAAKRDEILTAIAETSQQMEIYAGNLEDTEGQLAQYRAELQQRELEAEESLLQMEEDETQVADGGTPETEAPTEAEGGTEAPGNEGGGTETEPDAPSEPATEPPTEAPTEPPTESGDDFDYSAYSDLELVAAMIFREANMEPWEGKVAVGNVIMNRLNSSLYPDTILGVLSQPYQFSPWGNPRYINALVNGVPEECTRAARVAMAGTENYVGDCLHFRTASSGYQGIIIGNHVFY